MTITAICCTIYAVASIYLILIILTELIILIILIILTDTEDAMRLYYSSYTGI